jgi:Holliday junction DNA helicase RuvB
LIQEGYLIRTQRGRMATEAAYKHLGRVYHSTNDYNLF